MLGAHVAEVLHDQETDSEETWISPRGTARSEDAESKETEHCRQPASIPDYDPRFFRTCTFPVLRRLGYGTRVTINNGLPRVNPSGDAARADPQRLGQVRASTSAQSDDLGELQPGEIVKARGRVLPRPAFGREAADGDLLGMFHLGARVSSRGKTSAEVDH